MSKIKFQTPTQRQLSDSLVGNMSFLDRGFFQIPNLISASEIDSILNIVDSLRSTYPVIYEDPYLDAFNSKEQARLFSSSITTNYLFKSKVNSSIFDIKLAHNLHSIPTISDILETQILPRVSSIGLLEKTLNIVQSMFFFKEPGAPGVSQHQDASFVYDINYDCAGIFIALESCSAKNGGVNFTSEPYPLTQRLVSTDSEYSFMENLPETISQEYWECPTLSPGDGIFFSGYSPHFSGTNLGTTSRKAITFHGIFDILHPECWLSHPLPEESCC